MNILRGEKLCILPFPPKIEYSTRVRYLYSFSSLSPGTIGCNPLDHLNQEV